MSCETVSKLAETLDMKFRWKIKFMVEKPKPLMPNMPRYELKAVRSLRLNKDIRIFRQTKAISRWFWMYPNTRTS
jgi:hypothetical protein